MKKITLALAFFFCIFYTNAQTTLTAGDIAFVGSGVDAGGPFASYATFVLLTDIDAATQIIFTDRGWSDTTGFGPVGTGDGQLTWTSGTALSAGDVVTINLSFGQLSDGGAYAIQGDQLFAIQGSIANPIFIASLHFNVEPLGASGAMVTTNDANWDGNNVNNDESALPNALITGDTAVRLFGANGIEQDNYQFSCTLAGSNPITGTPAQIRAVLHNTANWNVSNTSGFNPALESGCAITVAAAMDNVPPTVTCAPTPPDIVAGINGMAAVPDLVSGSSATDNVTPSGDITITQSPTAGTMVPAGVSMVTVTAMDAAGNAANCMVNVTILEPPSTTLEAGDVAFLGINLDGNDTFAFIILEDIIAGTNIRFTDCGITNPNTITCSSGDGTNTWYAPTAMTAGSIVNLNGDFFPGFPLAAQGDQILAYQGTMDSPTFLGGIHVNIETGITNDDDWDGGATQLDESALPDQLTNGVNAIRVHDNEIDVDNWQLDCSSIPMELLIGTKEQIGAVINDLQYWISDNTQVFNPTVNAACVFTVIEDNVPPEITGCPTTISPAGLDASCEHTLIDYTQFITVTDAVDANPTITQEPMAGSTISMLTEVIITATDTAGNSSTCVFTVDVIDALSPTAVCTDIEVELGENGNASIMAEQLDGGSTDNCSTELAFSASQTDFTTADAGEVQVDLTVTDESGNMDTCTATVTVVNNNIPPTINCPEDIAVDNDSDSCGAVVSFTVEATDNGFPIDVSFTSDADDPITFESADDIGFLADFATDLPSVGILQAIAMGPNGDIYVGHENGVNSRILRFDGTTGEEITDFFPAGQLALAPLGLDFGPDGNLYVSVGVSDLVDDVHKIDPNTGAILQTFDLGVTELVDAVFGPDGKLYVGSGIISASIVRLDLSTGMVETFVDDTAGLTFPFGMRFGPDGNLYATNSFSGSITRYDGTTGALIDTFISQSGNDFRFDVDGDFYLASNGISKFDGSSGEFIARVTGDEGFDARDLLFKSANSFLVLDNSNKRISRYGPSTSAFFPVGTTTVTATAMDNAGNPLECSFTVTVVDATEPMITCPANVMLTSSTSEVLTADDIGMPTTSDNCEVATVVGTRSDTNSTDLTTDPYPQGVTTIVWTVTDVSGLQSTCEQTITIASPPTVSVPNVVGQSQADAESAIVMANLTVGMVTMANDVNVPAGNVISQNPTGGSSAVEGSSVDLIISAGPGCLVEITEQPESVTLCTGDSPSFSVEAAGTGTLSYQWQLFEMDLPNNSTGPVLNFPPTSVAADGNEYRVIVTSDNGTPNDTDDDCSVISDVAVLRVNPLPTVAFTALDDLMIDAGVQLGLGGGLPAQGTVMGDSGMYSGPGVSDNGDGTYDFDPAIAGVGVHEITYEYTNENGCSGLASDEVEVTMAMPRVLSITGFNLIDADNDVVLFPIVDGQQININDLPTMNLNIEAVATDDAESVRLELSGTQNNIRNENVFPYALFGDSRGNYRANVFALGNYDIMATPYSLDRQQGTMGTPLAINFDFVDTDPLCADFELTITEMTGPSTCGGNDGVLRLTVNDSRTVVVEFFINGEFIARVGVMGFASGLSLTALSAGEFLVEARTTEGCTETRTVILEDPELPEVTLAPFDPILDTDEAFALMGGSPMGGEYSGNGVTGGMFDPSIGAGSYEITYTFRDPVTNCSNSAVQTLTVTSTVQTNSVTAFYLVDADDDVMLFQINDGGQININDLPTTNLNIEAIATEDVESVFLEIAGGMIVTRRENVAPYALFGDSRGNYFGRNFGPGGFTVSATPYTGNNLQGDMGTTMSISFEIVLPPTAPNPIDLSIYPNPSISSVMATFDAEEKVQVERIQIFDVQGRLIRSYDAKRVKEGDGYRLDVYDMPVGSYFLRTQDAKGFSYSKQMVIER